MVKEKLVTGQSFIHELDPKIRILAAFVLSVSAALCDNLYISMIYLMVSIVLIIMGHLKFTDVMKRIKPLLWFLLMIWLIIPLTFKGEILYQYLWFKITDAGILMCCKITIKSITILLIFTALIATMTVASLGNGLHKLNVPDKMVFLVLMSYRYISVIEEEYKRLFRAAQFRGFQPGTNLHSYKTFAYLAGMLFVRASLRAQRVYKAMLCRGFNQKFHTLDVYPSSRLNSIFLISVLTASTGLVIIELLWI